MVWIALWYSTSQQSVRGIDHGYFPELVADVLRLALGIYLFSGGKGLARLWQKSHSMRVMKPTTK
jgi:hypothetical protein